MKLPIEFKNGQLVDADGIVVRDGYIVACMSLYEDLFRAAELLRRYADKANTPAVILQDADGTLEAAKKVPKA